MQSETNNLPPTLERYGVGGEIEVTFERCFELIQQTNLILVEMGLKALQPTCILSIAIHKALQNNELKEVIEMIKDYAKDNRKGTEKVIGKNLLQVILNCK